MILAPSTIIQIRLVEYLMLALSQWFSPRTLYSPETCVRLDKGSHHPPHAEDHMLHIPAAHPSQKFLGIRIQEGKK